MFTINIKGKANPKDPKMVKLEMIIFKTGYARVTKVLNVSGPVKDWDNQSQAFKGNGSTLTAKNKILFELKNQYQTVAEDWDYEGRVWSPVELSHCFNEVQTRKEEIKSLSVIQMIDSLIEKFTHYRATPAHGQTVLSCLFHNSTQTIVFAIYNPTQILLYQFLIYRSL